MTLSGDLSAVGFIQNGHAAGTLTLRNGRGTLTVQLTGPDQGGFAPLPDTFDYQVVGGTGAYKNYSGQGTLGGALDDVNALRMRTQEQFPNFGEVDDLANFEEIQRGLACLEDEWIYMHRGLGIPGRVRTLDDGTITAPATDEVFMREYIKEWKRLMKARPNLAIQREP